MRLSLIKLYLTNSKWFNIVRIILIFGALYVAVDSLKYIFRDTLAVNIFGTVSVPVLFLYLFHEHFTKNKIKATVLSSVLLSLLIWVAVGFMHAGFGLIFFSDIINFTVAYTMVKDDLISGIALGVVYYLFILIRNRLKN